MAVKGNGQQKLKKKMCAELNDDRALNR